MVERILQLIEREIRGIHEAAYLLGFFALLSQVLALVRDRLLASLFGAGETLDIYYAAFRIPDLIFVGVASFVSAFVLIPFFANYAASSKEEAKAFLDTIFTIFFVAISAISAACAVFAPQLLSLFFPTLSASSLAEEFVLISRILLLQPVLLGLSGLLSTVTQAHRKFILYAISPILYNVGILAGIIFFYPSMGLSGIALGVVSGALLHLGIQLPSIVSSGFLPRLRLALPLTEAMKVFALSLPRTAGLFAGQLSFFVLVALAVGTQSLVQPAGGSALHHRGLLFGRGIPHAGTALCKRRAFRLFRTSGHGGAPHYFLVSADHGAFYRLASAGGARHLWHGSVRLE